MIYSQLFFYPFYKRFFLFFPIPPLYIIIFFPNFVFSNFSNPLFHSFNSLSFFFECFICFPVFIIIHDFFRLLLEERSLIAIHSIHFFLYFFNSIYSFC
nr:MAG TPA: hypothetical protein [Caudoviricetes sp.]